MQPLGALIAPFGLALFCCFPSNASAITLVGYELSVEAFARQNQTGEVSSETKTARSEQSNIILSEHVTAITSDIAVDVSGTAIVFPDGGGIATFHTQWSVANSIGPLEVNSGWPPGPGTYAAYQFRTHDPGIMSVHFQNEEVFGDSARTGYLISVRDDAGSIKEINTGGAITGSVGFSLLSDSNYTFFIQDLSNVFCEFNCGDLELGAIFKNQTGQISWLVAPVPVPLPVSLLLTGVALLMVAGTRRGRSR